MIATLDRKQRGLIAFLEASRRSSYSRDLPPRHDLQQVHVKVGSDCVDERGDLVQEAVLVG